MRQRSMRVPGDLHELAVAAANEQNVSLHTFATNALFAQVRAAETARLFTGDE